MTNVVILPIEDYETIKSCLVTIKADVTRISNQSYLTSRIQRRAEEALQLLSPENE